MHSLLARGLLANPSLIGLLFYDEYFFLKDNALHNKHSANPKIPVSVWIVG